MSRPASMASLLMDAIRARVEATSALHPADDQLLRGLHGVARLGVRLSRALEVQGLQAAKLREQVDQQLAIARIPTPSPREGVVLAGLEAEVKGVEANDGLWVVCVALALKQRARLGRDSTAAFDATTWVAEAPAVCAAVDLESTCARLVAELTEQLATALRGAGVGEGR